MTYLIAPRIAGLLCFLCLLGAAPETSFAAAVRPAGPARPIPNLDIGHWTLNIGHSILVIGHFTDACSRPELLQADLVTDSTARLTWSDVGDKFEVELAVGADPFTGTPTHIVDADPPFDVSGLTPGRNYRFQVRTVCDDTTASVWSAPRSFVTDLNNARPCPLNLDLRDTSCNNLQVFRLHVDEAPGQMLGADVRLHGVRLMVEHAWRSDLSIWLRAPDSARIQLIGGLNAGDKNIGNPQGIVCAQSVELTDNTAAGSPLSAAAEKDNITGYFLPAEALAGLHTGQNPLGIWQVEICDSKADHKGKLRLFDLVFARVDCPLVENVTATNVTETSALVSWQTDATGDSLVLEYGPAGFIPGAGSQAGTGGTVVELAQPAATPVMISNLLTLQWYEVYLRRRCAPGIWGPNSLYAKFFTNCPPTLLETADTLSVCPTGCPDPCPLPGIWQNVPGDDYEWKVYAGPGLFYPVAGPPAGAGGSGNYLYFRNSCSPAGAFGKTAILRTLCIDVVAPPAQVCHFSFDLYMNTRIGQMSALALQASTDGGQSWITVQTWSGNRGKNWNREYVNLSAFNGQIALFQFVATGTFGVYGDIAIDNLAFYGSQEAGTPDYVFYRDADNDNFGDPDIRVISCFPTPPPGYVEIDSDCNDANPAVYPGAVEILCNQADENCNGPADDSLVPTPAAAANVAICRGETATLAVNGTPLGQFYWYDQPSGGVPLGAGNTLVLNNLNATQTYYLADSLTGPGNGCSSSRTPATVTINPTPVLTLASTPTICAGSTFDLSALPVVDTANSGGLLTYHYATPPTPANQLPSPVVQPGTTATFYIRSTTTAGCTGARAVTIFVLPSPEVQIVQGDSVNVCRGRTLQLQAQEGGVGLPPIAYAWSTGLNFPNIPVQTGSAPNVTKTYTVTVTDANGCTGTDAIRVYTLNNVTQTAIEAIQNVSTCGGVNGSITLRPLNGTAPYTFSWSGGALTGVTGSGTITGLTQGSYRITVTDATNAGCSMVMPQIVLNAPGLDVALDTVIHPACPGALTGSIVLDVNGQNPAYLWSNQQTTPTAAFLGAGIYSVTITDGNCTQVLSNLEVVSPAPIDIIQNALNPVGCFGDSTGNIDLAVFGATPPYNYLWSNGAVSEDLTNLPVNNYRCTITDANGCTFTSPQYTIAQPQLLTIQPDSLTNVRCFNEKSGFLRVKAAGGKLPYSYLWNTGATTASLGNVIAGIYAVTVTDANGCTADWLGVVTQPSSLQIEFTLKQNPTCIGAADGSIELVLTGGQPPFQVNWSHPGGNTPKIQNLGVGQYFATITDAKGCVLVPSGIALTAPQLLTVTLDSLTHVRCRGDQTGLIAVQVSGAVGNVTATWNGIPDDLIRMNAGAGPYILQATDSRGCTIKDTFLVSEPEVALNIVVLEVRDALCAGEPTGSISIRVNGGTLPYQYQWSNGATAQNLPAVPAGAYALTVTDAHGCTKVLPAIMVGEPPALQASAVVHSIPCFGVLTGDIQLTVSGGIPSYRYMWNTTDTTRDIFNLPAGKYSVTILDATGCAQVLSDLEVIDQAADFTLDARLVQPVSCHGAADGHIAVQVMNGAPPFQFSWSAPVGLHANLLAPMDSAAGLSGGEYWVTVTDAAGCTVVSGAFSIEEAPPLQLNIDNIVNLICTGDSLGAISVNVSGGVPPYSYLWNNGSTQSDLGELPAGTYQLSVTDVRGCSIVSAEAIVHEPAEAIQIALVEIQDDACGKNEGSIALNITGGVPPQTYLWNNGATAASLSGLPPALYQLTVTDNLGCTAVSTWYEIEQLAPPLGLTAADIMPVLCYGDSTGAIIPTVAGGTPGYQYAWSNGSTATALLDIPAGNYTLTVTDIAGCFEFFPFSVAQPASPLATTWTTDSLPAGWMITLSPSGGALPYDIRWGTSTGNQTGPVATGLEPGLYSATITDANNCNLIVQIPAGTFTSTGVPEVWTRYLLAPNPSSGRSRLELDLRQPEAVRVRIFSSMGQMLTETTWSEPAAQHRIALDLSRQPAGWYWIAVQFSNGQEKTFLMVHTGG
ncbi:MAG: hypothetical protein IPM81_14765 [Saprospirales bacterium]|nr:hypothetical protein [Saprospirales bacterium]